MPSFNWGRPEEGAPTTYVDVDENEIIYREHQPAEDIRAIVDQTRAFGQLTQSEKSTPHGTRWAGSVPITIYMDWLKEWKNAGHKHFNAGYVHGAQVQQLGLFRVPRRPYRRAAVGDSMGINRDVIEEAAERGADALLTTVVHQSWTAVGVIVYTAVVFVFGMFVALGIG